MRKDIDYYLHLFENGGKNPSVALMANNFQGAVYMQQIQTFRDNITNKNISRLSYITLLCMQQQNILVYLTVCFHEGETVHVKIISYKRRDLFCLFETAENVLIAELFNIFTI